MILFRNFSKNITEEIKHNELIIKYSDINIKENFNDPYSILNPDTNSDSPSEKSNGVRFNSAITLINHNKINGIKNNLE